MVFTKKRFITGLIIFSFLLFLKGAVFASTTDGTIEPANRYGYSENAGWIDFGSAQGNVHITDAALTGYAWGENTGWISLNCSNDTSCGAVDYEVANDTNGNLSGYGYGENIGWINFNPTGGGVSINASGEFEGYAWGENTGWVMFNCSANTSCLTVDFKVSTDYRPSNSSARAVAAPATSYYPTYGGTSHPPEEVEKKKTIDNFTAQADEIFKKALELAGKVSELPQEIINIFKPQPEQPETPITTLPIEEVVTQEVPLSLKGEWDLISPDLINSFVFAPLPSNIRELADKLPQIKDAFNKLGITDIKDIERLRGANITLPNLIQVLSAIGETQLTPEQMSELSDQLKELIPEDMVFSSLVGNKLPLNPSLTISDEGEIEQKITAFPNKPLTLTLKPERSVKQIKGYVVFKSENPLAKKENKTGLAKILSSITASLAEIINRKQTKQILLLNEFQYFDQDNDGIYTADIITPSTIAIYQIVSELDYEDNSLNKKELKMTLVVDPEGYVYQKIRNQELRIKEAVVSLFWLNPENQEYELWEAGDFQQTNPQTTDNTGRYSFLVPEGEYYLKVEVNNYLTYQGEPFEVRQGSGIHQNIELKSKYWWVGFFDWNILIAVLLAIIIILLLWKFRRDKIIKGKL